MENDTPFLMWDQFWNRYRLESKGDLPDPRNVSTWVPYYDVVNTKLPFRVRLYTVAEKPLWQRTTNISRWLVGCRGFPVTSVSVALRISKAKGESAERGDSELVAYVRVEPRIRGTQPCLTPSDKQVNKLRAILKCARSKSSSFIHGNLVPNNVHVLEDLVFVLDLDPMTVNTTEFHPIINLADFLPLFEKWAPDTQMAWAFILQVHRAVNRQTQGRTECSNDEVALNLYALSARMRRQQRWIPFQDYQLTTLTSARRELRSKRNSFDIFTKLMQGWSLFGVFVPRSQHTSLFQLFQQLGGYHESCSMTATLLFDDKARWPGLSKGCQWQVNHDLARVDVTAYYRPNTTTHVNWTCEGVDILVRPIDGDDQQWLMANDRRQYPVQPSRASFNGSGLSVTIRPQTNPKTNMESRNFNVEDDALFGRLFRQVPDPLMWWQNCVSHARVIRVVWQRKIDARDTSQVVWETSKIQDIQQWSVEHGQNMPVTAWKKWFRCPKP